MLNEATEWALMGVFGPQSESNKVAFLDEIKSLKQNIQTKWLLSGDFNLIYKAEDKSISRLNRRLMGKFKAVLDDLELKELPLHGKSSPGQAVKVRKPQPRPQQPQQPQMSL
jgi:hypothetical protein